MSSLLTDEVWATLDSHAGRLPRRDLKRLWWAIAIVAGLIAAYVVVALSGVVVPRLSVANQAFNAEGPATISPQSPSRMSFDLLVHNAGYRPLTITAIGESRPGLDVVRPLAPVTVPARASATVFVSFTLTDCRGDLMDESTWRLPATVDRFWGGQHVDIDLSPMDTAHEFAGLVKTVCHRS